jgi:alkanesulfonate monooxygenase SsuD/methylene tetrahydromethanopterin reductase-like flavin-dependent oxidoreductase (luciferase family)
VIRIGYAFGPYTNPAGEDHLFDAIAAQVRAAEDAGFDSVWCPIT